MFTSTPLQFLIFDINLKFKLSLVNQCLFCEYRILQSLFAWIIFPTLDCTIHGYSTILCYHGTSNLYTTHFSGIKFSTSSLLIYFKIPTCAPFSSQSQLFDGTDYRYCPEIILSGFKARTIYQLGPEPKISEYYWIWNIRRKALLQLPSMSQLRFGLMVSVKPIPKIGLRFQQSFWTNLIVQTSNFRSKMTPKKLGLLLMK